MKRLISTFGKDLRRVKSGILCLGMRVSQDAFAKIFEAYPLVAEETFVHGAHFLLEGKVMVNATISEDFARSSPYDLRLHEERLVLFKGKDPQCNLEVIQAPKWYSQTTSDGIKMSDVLRQHGHCVLADACFNKCDFQSEGKPCLMCSFRGTSLDEGRKIRSVQEIVQTALEENPGYSVALSEGARNSPDRGASYLSRLCSSIRKVNGKLAISVELVPPDDNSFLDELIDSGATALIMNLEFCDERIRSIFCSGKSVVKRSRYFDVLSYTVRRLGRGNVSSVLIAGIERPDLTIACAKQMVDIGVIPTIMPFRPYDHCVLANFRKTSPTEFEAVAKTVGQLLARHDLNPALQGGCTGCGGCSLETEYLVRG